MTLILKIKVDYSYISTYWTEYVLPRPTYAMYYPFYWTPGPKTSNLYLQKLFCELPKKTMKSPFLEGFFFLFYIVYVFCTFFASLASGFFDDDLCWWVGDGLGCQQTDIDCLPCSHEYWYPLDFLPNYPARKCFIISAYKAGTVPLLLFLLSPVAGWGKQKYIILLKLALPRLCLCMTVQ